MGILVPTLGYGSTIEVVSKTGPHLNQGLIKGSVRVMSADNLNLNSGLTVEGALVLPGTPDIRLNGGATSPPVSNGSGSSLPSGYRVTLNSGVSLGGIKQRVDPEPLPAADVPVAGGGTRKVDINQPGDSAGDFATIKTLTLNAQGSSLTLPPGRYERITLNGASTISLQGGTSAAPALYEIQQIDLNGGSHLKVSGPVLLKLRNSLNANGYIGDASHPEWLTMSLSAGSFTLNSQSAFHGKAIVPAGTLTVNGGSLLHGQAFTERLILNGGGVIECEASGGTPNQPPVATASEASTPLGTPVQVTLQASDPEGQTLSYTLVTPPSHGTVNTTTGNTLPGATVLYTPENGFAGTDVFYFKANDGSADSETVAVTIHVFQPNRAPMAKDKVFVVNQGENNAPLTLEASDPDGDALSWQILSQPTQGVLAGTAPTLTYSHTGTRTQTEQVDSFTYQVVDSNGATSGIATATLRLQPVNRVPVVSPLVFETQEDTTVSFALNASDADGDALTYSYQLPEGFPGTITGTVPDLTYTPARDFHGTANFSFTVTDGLSSPVTGTVAITVVAANDAPEASAVAAQMDEDAQEVAVTLTATDADGEALTYAYQLPEDFPGTITGTAPDLSFTPAADFHGTAIFSYTATDSHEATASGTVTLTVLPVNDAPVAHAATLEGDEDHVIDILLTGDDVDGDTLTYAYQLPPGFPGTISGSAPTLSFTPLPNFHGTTGFTYTITDPDGFAATASITLVVRSQNDAPVALPIALQTQEDSPVAITLSGTDADGDTLTYDYQLPGDFPGAISGQAPNLTFTPAANFHGNAVFFFTVSDGSSPAVQAAANITVLPVNDAPVAQAVAAEGNEDQAFEIHLLGSDVDGDPLSYSYHLPESFPGTIEGSGAALRFVPAVDYYGTTGFEYTVTDAAGLSSTAQVSLTVHAVNDVPVVSPVTVQTNEDTQVAVILSAADVDGDALVFDYQVPANFPGAISGQAPNLVFVPAANFHGTVHLPFTVTDGHGDPVTGEVSITVEAVNDAPSALSLALETNEDIPLPITLAGSDQDGDALTYTVQLPPGFPGVLEGDGATRTFTPNADFHGVTGFTYTVTDGAGLSSIASVELTVNAVNDAPEAVASHGTARQNDTLVLSLSATDKDGDPLTFAVVSAASHGSVVINGSQATYKPDPGFSGVDRFRFTANDGLVSSQSAEVIVVVDGAPAAVIRSPLDGAKFKSGEPVQTQVEAHDPEGNVAAVELLLDGIRVGGGTSSPFQISLNGLAAGRHELIASATDSSGQKTASSPVTFVIEGANQAPVVSAGSDRTVNISTLGPNLLINGGNEAALENGAIPGWTTVGSVAWGKGTPSSRIPPAYNSTGNWASTNYPSASEGGFFFHVLANSSGELYQDVPLTGHELEIAGGRARLNFEALTRSYQRVVVVDPWEMGYENDRSKWYFPTGELDHPSVVIEFWDASGTQLIAAQAVDSAPTTDRWQKLWTTLEIPAGAAKARIRLVATKLDSATTDPNEKNDAMFDAVSVRLNTTGSDILSGSVADDGQPENGALSLRWEQLSGPSAVIADAAKAATAVRFSDPGDYEFRLEASDGELTSSDTVRVRLAPSSGNGMPAVNAGADATVSFRPMTPIQLNGVVNDDTSGLVTEWSLVSGPERVSFANANSAATSVTVSGPGVYVLKLRACDGEWSAEDTVTLTVNDELVRRPLDLEIVIDHSGSMWALKSDADPSTPIYNARIAARRLIGALDPTKDRVAVRRNHASLSPLSNNLTTANAALIQPLGENLFGVTIAHSSVDAGIGGAYKELIANPRSTGTLYDRAIVVLNDGAGPYPDVMARAARAAGIRVIVVSFPNGIDPIDTVNSRIQASSPSDFLVAQKAEDADALFASLQRNLSLVINRPPVVNAGDPLWLAKVSDRSVLQGSFQDDGLPSNATFTAHWEQLSGPGAVTFNDATSLTPEVSFSIAGEYRLRLTVNDGETHDSDILTVKVAKSAGIPAPAGLTSWWPFDGHLRDLVGGRNLTRNDYWRSPQFTTSPLNEAVQFLEEDDILRTGEIGDLGLNTPEGFSIEFRMRPRSSVPGVIFSIVDPEEKGTERLCLTWGDLGSGGDRQLVLESANASTAGYYYIRTRLTNSAISENEWHHVLLSCDRRKGEVWIYVDGVGRKANISSIGAFFPANCWLTVGGRTFLRPNAIYSSSYPGVRFNGDLDDLAFYSRPLMAEEVLTLSQAVPDGKTLPSVDRPPVVEAGSPIREPDSNASVALNGFASDDTGNPTVLWSKLSGPGSVMFADASSPVTTATFDAPGLYTLQLEASDSFASSKDVLLVQIGSSPAISAPWGMVAWMPGNQHTQDLISNRTGTWSGTAAYAPVKVGDGFQFGGSVSRVRYLPPDLPPAVTAQGFTLETWMYVPSGFNGSYNYGFFSFQNAAAVRFHQLELYAASTGNFGSIYPSFKWTVSQADGSEQNVMGSMQCPVNRAFHLALLYNPQTGKLQSYIDGGLVKEQTAVGIPVHHFDKELNLGTSPGDARIFPGRIDEFSLYNRALTQAEITAIVQAGANGKFPSPAAADSRVNAGPDLALERGASHLFAPMIDQAAFTGGAIGYQWTIVSGPALATFDNAALANATATFAQPGRYVLQLTVSAGTTVVADTVTVEVVNPVNEKPVIQFNDTLALQLPQGTVDLQPQVIDDGLPNGSLISRWAMLSGPGAVSFTDLDSFKTRAIFPAAGEYQLVFEVSDGLATTYHNVHVSVAAPLPPNQAPIVNAGADFVSDSAIFTLNGSATDDGQPANQPLAYTWSVVSAPGPVSFTNGTAKVVVAGTYRLNLKVSDSELSGNDEVTIVVPESASGLPNRAPSVSLPALATADLPGATVSFVPVVTDDGRTPGPLAFAWTQLDGPAAAVVAQPVSAATSVSFTTAGDYLFQLSVSDGALTATARVQVRVNAPDNRAPVVAIASATSAKPYETKLLSATVTDDGQPSGTLTYAWRQLSGPDLAFLETPATAQTQVTFGRGGSYVFELLVSDGAASTRATVAWNVIGTPDVRIVSPASGTQVTDRALLTLQGRAWIDGGSITSLNFEKNGQSIGTGVRQNGTDDWLLQLPPLGLGSHTITAVATSADGQTKTSGPVSFEIVDFEEQALTLDITAPFEGDAITGPAAVIGSAYSTRLAAWTLSLTPVVSGGQAQPAAKVIASSTRPVMNDVLGTIDPTLLQNGAYQLTLSGTTTAGASASYSVPFTIEGNMKIGHFSLAFEDLSVPLAGLPLTVTRVYDSRDTKTGDFGPAWNVGLNSVRLRKIGRLGEGWEQEQVISGFFPLHSVNSTTRKRVVLTFPDGRTETFEPELRAEAPLSADQPNVQKILGIQSGYLQFKAITGSKGTLAIEGNSDVLWNGEIPGRGQLIDASFQSVNPTRFRYTEPEGTSYVIDESAGLMSVSEPNGNTLTINRDGLFHSTGENVLFTRDAQGRITEVTDPAGAKVLYGYDASGRLHTVTDRADAVTTFHYENPNFPYYLTRIVDPRGIDAIRTEYGEDGRMARQIDAAGQAIEFEHDLADNREIVRDRLGNVTVHEYDDRGNVTRTTDALGGVTAYAYDANDNEVSVRSPLGHVTTRVYDAKDNLRTETDPAGGTTSYTYDASRRPLTLADALGRTTRMGYSFNGNLTSMTDAAGTATAFGYDLNGNLATLTDALGTKTSHTYDAKGRELTMTVRDAAGNLLRSESYTNDDAGRRLTATRYLGQTALVTAYEYDDAGRVTKTTLPDGSTSRTIYNAIGKPWKTLDTAGRETVMDYDARGNLVKTTFPDGTSTSSAYDVEGRQTATTDASGATTYTLYDALGRATATILPDATMPATVLTEVADIAAASALADNPRQTTAYDADGRVLTTTDANGNTTTFEYDAAGRRTATVNALNQRTTYAYDAAGRQTAVTDARNATTTFEYDAAGRLTRTVFPDNTFTATAYDTLGRRVSTTAQDGRVTRYEYDVLGRMIAVVDPAGNRTGYEYDALGRQTVQRDALGHETRYEFDALDRRTARVLPMGQRETYVYDTLGRLTSRTDFNGHVTGFEYHPQNDRLLATAADAAHPSLVLPHAPARFEFGYDVLGRRTSATVKNAGGNVLHEDGWSYDILGRMSRQQSTTGTLDYAWDAGGNLSGVKSVTPGGYDLSYDYDALGRLATVYEGQEGIDPASRPIAAYGYDANGNLAGVGYANGIQHAYAYDALNRLTGLNVARQAVGNGTPATPVQGYAYTLDPAGRRTGIAELGGRTIANTFDALGRLTRETIGGATLSPTGTLAYTYDAVGNRLSRATTGGLTALLPNQAKAFTANDQLTSDSYDGNGNTTSSLITDHGSLGTSSATDVYSFDNRLIRRTRGDGVVIDLTYNADGDRMSKRVTQNGLTRDVRLYLVDRANPTGYAQVVEEKDHTGQLVARHLYGHDLIASSLRNVAQLRYYHYDGLGSVRGISDDNGDLQETYDYDAYGTLIGLTKRDATTGELVPVDLTSSNSEFRTPNSEFLFTGEQFDADLGMYFLRARYLNPDTGRFHTQDTYEGQNGEPLSLHKYLYAHANPVMNTDPSGMFIASTLIYGQIVHDEIGAHFLTDRGSLGHRAAYDESIASILSRLRGSKVTGAVGNILRPDLVDLDTGEIWEIKPILSAALAFPQVAQYIVLLTLQSSPAKMFLPGVSYRPPTVVSINAKTSAVVFSPSPGVILYYVNNTNENFLSLAAIGTSMVVSSLNTMVSAIGGRTAIAGI